MLLKSIQALAVKFCTLNDSMVVLEDEHKVLYNRYKNTKDDINTHTTRTKTDIRNIQRQIKVTHWETNQNKSQMTGMRTEMEHARRIKMHYDRHMLKTHTATFRTQSHNTRLINKDVKTKETIKRIRLSHVHVQMHM